MDEEEIVMREKKIKDLHADGFISDHGREIALRQLDGQRKNRNKQD